MHSKDAQPSHTSVYRFKNNLGQKTGWDSPSKPFIERVANSCTLTWGPLEKKKGPDATPQKQQLILQTLWQIAINAPKKWFKTN